MELLKKLYSESLSHNAKRYKKQDFEYFFRDLCERLETADPYLLERIMPSLLVLSQKFAPPIPSKKTPFGWCAGAVCADSRKVKMGHVYSDGKTYTAATNAFRLHIIHTPQPEEGFYSKHGVKIEKAVDFPDVFKFVPKSTPHVFPINEIEVKMINLNTAELIIPNVGSVWVNPRFWQEATKPMKNPVVYFGDDLDKFPIKISGTINGIEATAIVMPIEKP